MESFFDRFASCIFLRRWISFSEEEAKQSPRATRRASRAVGSAGAGAANLPRPHARAVRGSCRLDRR
jgi:hypothetical protein